MKMSKCIYFSTQQRKTPISVESILSTPFLTDFKRENCWQQFENSLLYECYVG